MGLFPFQTDFCLLHRRRSVFTKEERMVDKMAFTVTKDSLIGDILDYDGTTAECFLEAGMHCLGCPAARGESIEQACEVHGIDVNELIEALNKHLA